MGSLSLHKNQRTQRKLLNFENWTNGELAKIRACKVEYFILPLFLTSKLGSMAQNEWKKHPNIFFLLSVKKKEFERKKSEKNSKILKVAGNHPNI